MKSNSPSGRFIGAIERFIIDPLFPRSCERCFYTLAHGEAVLCSACRKAMPFLERSPARCRRCDAVLAESACECTGASFGTNRSLFEYNAVSDMLHRMKFSRRYSIAAFFGALMAEREGDHIRGYDVIVPVPLHPRRRRERGYDQARIIAHGASATGVPVVAAAVRERYTNALTLTQSAAERRTTIAGAFAIADHDAVRGRAVLLIDDVVTTGSTISELAHAVRAAGADKADVLSIARA